MIKKKKGAGILAINKSDGKILLGKRGEDGSCPKCWAPFGGTFEESDGNPKYTAKREFLEETNILSKYQISKEPFYVNNNPFLDFYTFIAVFNKKPNVIISEESLDYGWFYLHSLPNPLHPGVKEMIEKKYNTLENIINKLINNYN